MGDPSPYQYTYKDIERYHSGQMPADEMHRMEMAALDDPFLADALEGYTHTSFAKTDLEKLNERLNERTKRRAKVLWISKNYNALKVAAVLLFVIAGSWLLVVSKQKAASNLAYEKKPDSVSNQTSKISNSSSQVDKAIDTNKEGYKNETATTLNATQKKKTNYTFDINKQKDSNAVASMTTKTNSENTQSAASPPSKDNASNAGIAPEARMNNTRVSRDESKLNKDSADKFYSNANDANIAIKKANDTIKNVDVVLKPQALPNLSEVVVTKSNGARKTSRSPFAVADTLEPEDGWDEYNDYIANNIKSPEETKVKSLTGEVELSFDVNRDGRPINIKVEKSLCDPCDTEAIRLLKEGPKWKKKKNKKGKLRIHF